ncbi:hypothetical protein [Paraburkholderia fungorum]|uniref:hypothetical protein n=1 Tax=Paraburkholderia fungorum TaxID=134537 RepID=UPI0038B924AF
MSTVVGCILLSGLNALALWVKMSRFWMLSLGIAFGRFDFFGFLPLAAAFPGSGFFGLSLLCYWFISVPPVRGAPTFLCRRKEK